MINLEAFDNILDSLMNNPWSFCVNVNTVRIFRAKDKVKKSFENSDIFVNQKRKRKSDFCRDTEIKN